MGSVGVKRFELTLGSEEDYGRVMQFQEAATQSFEVGDPVKLNTAGNVLLGVDTEAFFGVAMAPASGTTNALVDILPVNSDQVWSGTASSAGATRTTALTDIGVEVSYIKSTITGSTLITVLDFSDTTTPTMVALNNDRRDDPDNAFGIVDGRYLFRFLPGTVSTGGLRVISI